MLDGAVAGKDDIDADGGRTCAILVGNTERAAAQGDRIAAAERACARRAGEYLKSAAAIDHKRGLGQHILVRRSLCVVQKHRGVADVPGQVAGHGRVIQDAGVECRPAGRGDRAARCGQIRLRKRNLRECEDTVDRKRRVAVQGQNVVGGSAQVACQVNRRVVGGGHHHIHIVELPDREIRRAGVETVGAGAGRGDRGQRAAGFGPLHDKARGSTRVFLTEEDTVGLSRDEVGGEDAAGRRTRGVDQTLGPGATRELEHAVPVQVDPDR